MNNIGRIFRDDVRNLFRNVTCVIITVGLIILPSLFAWYNILACWNVFDNTGNLSIAVANEDEGYTSDLMPVSINVGDKVVSALRANKQINWVITGGEDAVEGAKSGKYYASLVIPDDFSRQLLTFYEGESDSATIEYYVNEKKNAISPNITGAGADTVSYQVNQAFAETISEVGVGLAKALSNEADNIDLASTIGDLTSHMRTVSSRIDQTANVLVLYSSLGKETQSLLNSTTSLVESTRAKADSALAGVSSDKEALRGLVSNLETAINDLTSSIEKNKAELADLEGKLDSLLSSATADLSSTAAQIRANSGGVDGIISDLNARKAVLEQLRAQLQSTHESELAAIIQRGGTEAEKTAFAKASADSLAALDEAIAVLSTAVNTLQNASGDLAQAAESIESGGPDMQGKIDEVRQSIEQVKASIEAVANEFEANLKPGVDRLKADVQTLVADLDSAASSLSSLGSDLPGLTKDVDASFNEISTKIDDACDKLRAASSKMSGLADSIDMAMTSGDIDKLRSLLAGNVEDIAVALSAPVTIQREALYPADNFGSSMAPLYCALAMFIGSLIIMVATKPAVSSRGREKLDNPKPRHLYFGRFGVVALLSLMQTTLLGLGNMLFLKVQVTEPLLYMLCFWISGLVYVFIIYTLVVSFGNLGKAIAVLLLIVQVTACGGSYPLQILPDFVQMLSPFMPATHVVNAIRAAMFGLYQNDFWVSMGCLLLFVVPFLLLGLVLRKPLERFMQFYVSKVEESGMME